MKKIMFLIAISLVLTVVPTAYPVEQQKQVVIVFNGMITDVSIAHLIGTVDEKVRQGATTMTILINSNGGNVDQAVAAYNYLRGVPATITTHNFGVADSSAVILYCAGAKRLATPDTRFLLHGIAVTFQPNVDQNQIGEVMRMLEAQTDIMADTIAKTIGKPRAAVMAAITAKTVLTAEKSKEWGLVTAIESRLYEGGADVVIVQMQ